jgi:hypothetical protein
MARKWWIAIAALVVAVVIGLVFFPGLTRRIRLLSQAEKQDDQARREVLAPPLTTPTDVAATAKIFWAAAPDKLAPVSIQLPLSADPAQRAKQVLHALIVLAPTPDERTLPADTEVLGFYILSDGSAVADFSDALVSETPSGILSEQLVIDSITQTLQNNLPSLRRLKILIHGQEVETLAGHIDLTGFFDLNPPMTPDQSSVAPAAPGSPASGVPAAPSSSAAVAQQPTQPAAAPPVKAAPAHPATPPPGASVSKP